MQRSGCFVLSINRPRRIFRSALPRLDPRALLAVLSIGLIAAACVVLAMLPHHKPPAPPPPGEDVNAPPAQVPVIDGGTLKLRDRVALLEGGARRALAYGIRPGLLKHRC
jgi:hypothetical protein